MKIALVYIVAGLSSRFGGKIKSFAKVTDDETLIEYSINQAIPAGITEIIFVVGEHTEKQFREKFGNSYKGVPIIYVFQEFDKIKRDKPWGTCDAFCSAKKVLDSPVIVCNGDDLYGEEPFKILVGHLKNKQTCATMGYRLGDSLPEEGEVSRGIFTIEDSYVKSITERLGVSKENLTSIGLSEDDLCSMNIFALFPKDMEELEKQVIKFKEENKNDRKIECFMPIEINNLIKQKKIAMEIYPTQSKWFGITNPGDELRIIEKLKLIKK